MYQQRLNRKRKVWDESLPLPGRPTVDEAIRLLARQLPPVLSPAPTVDVGEPPSNVVPIRPIDEPQIAGQFNPQELMRRPRLEPVVQPVIAETIPSRPPVMPASIVDVPLLNRTPPLEVLNEPSPVMTEGGMRPVRRVTGDTLADAVDYQDQLQRYKPKNNNSRLKSFGLGLLRGFGQGGLGGAIFGGVSHLIKPNLDEEYQRGIDLERTTGEVGQEIGRRKAIADLESDQTINDLRRAQIPYLLARPELEAEKIQAKREYDTWRMKSGDRKADTYENFVKWKMENGDRRATSYEDYLEFQKASTDRRLTEAERHNQVSEDIGRAGIGVRQEANAISRERVSGVRDGEVVPPINAEIERQVGELRREQAGNEALANNPAADPYTREQARRRAQQVRDRIGQIELRKKPVRSVPARTLPKLSEQQIRAAAKARGLDEEEAVKRARSRGQL